MSNDPTYEGETKPRTRRITQLLTFLSPGLGFLYHGRPLGAFAANASYLTILSLAIVLVLYLNILPVLPVLILILGGLAVSKYLSHWLNSNRSEPYRLKAYNHWLIYTLFFIFTYFLPIAAGVTYVFSNHVAFDRVESSIMYPSIKPGDVVFVDRQSYRNSNPEKGDIVWLRPPNDLSSQTLRVVGVPGDIIQISGPALYINNEPVDRASLSAEKNQKPSEPPVNPEYAEKFQFKWEQNGGALYPIAISPRVISEFEMKPKRLKPGEYFLLADNRSLVPLNETADEMKDSRHFGTVTRDRIRGKVRYVSWSSRDTSILPRPSRIGVKLR